jgi:hypothetical protein
MAPGSGGHRLSQGNHIPGEYPVNRLSTPAAFSCSSSCCFQPCWVRVAASNPCRGERPDTGRLGQAVALRMRRTQGHWGADPRAHTGPVPADHGARRPLEARPVSSDAILAMVQKATASTPARTGIQTIRSRRAMQTRNDPLCSVAGGVLARCGRADRGYALRRHRHGQT